MLRLDRILDDAGDGKVVDRIVAVLQGVNRAGTDWESVCPANPAHRGFIVRVERVLEEHVPIAWCCQGCSDRAVVAALNERLRKPGEPKEGPRVAPPAVSATPPMVGLTEAAQALDCHRRTVRAYIRAGLLPGRLLAGRWKIRREDLNAFIEDASVAPTPTKRSADR